MDIERNRERWGNPGSYQRAWRERALIAAAMVPDNVSVVEVGVGTGSFRDLVDARCQYHGFDLAPLDERTAPLDLDSEAIGHPGADYVVALGVLEYLSNVDVAITRICAVGQRAIVSYCYPRAGLDSQEIMRNRRGRGWVNDLSRAELLSAFKLSAFRLSLEHPYNEAVDFEQAVLLLERVPATS